MNEDDKALGNPGSKSVNISQVMGNVNIGDSPEYRVGSAINELLIRLAKKPRQFSRIRRSPSAETIVKIKHNDLSARTAVIKQYLDYSVKVEEAYDEIDSLIVSGKDIILCNLSDLYFSALDCFGITYLDTEEIEISKIREHSIAILDYVIAKLRNTVYESNNLPEYKEQIELGVNVVVAHAFIECIVLENPSA